MEKRIIENIFDKWYKNHVKDSFDLKSRIKRSLNEHAPELKSELRKASLSLLKEIKRDFYEKYPVDDIHMYLEENFKDRYDYTSDGIIVKFDTVNMKYGKNHYLPIINPYLRVGYFFTLEMFRDTLWAEEALHKSYHPHAKGIDLSYPWSTRLCLGDSSLADVNYLYFLIRSLNYFPIFLSNFYKKDVYNQLSNVTKYSQDIKRFASIEIVELSRIAKRLDLDFNSNGVQIVNNQKNQQILIETFPSELIHSQIDVESLQTEYDHLHIDFKGEKVYVKVKETFNKNHINTTNYEQIIKKAERFYTQFYIKTCGFRDEALSPKSEQACA